MLFRVLQFTRKDPLPPILALLDQNSPKRYNDRLMHILSKLNPYYTYAHTQRTVCQSTMLTMTNATMTTMSEANKSSTKKSHQKELKAAKH